MSEARAGWFIARRQLTRRPAKTVTAGAVGFAAMLVVTAALMVLTAITPSAEQLRVQGVLDADAVLNTGYAEDATSSAAALEATRDAFTAQYGDRVLVSPAILALDLAVSAGSGTDAVRRTTVQYLELDAQRLDIDASSVLLRGGWPSDAAEIAVSQTAADTLQIAPGGRISLALGQEEATVVGVYRENLAHDALSVVAAPGTWRELVADAPAAATVTALERAYVRVDGSDRGRFLSDTAGFDNTSPLGMLPGFEGLEERGVTISVWGAAAPELRTFWERNTTVFTIPAVALLALLVGVYQAVRLRRDIALSVSLSALGLRRRQVAAINATVHAVPAALGIVAGGAVGFGLGMASLGVVSTIVASDVSTSPMPGDVIVGSGVALLALTAAISAVVGWRAARDAEGAAETAGFTAPLPVPVEHTRMPLAVMAVSTAGAVAAAIIAPRGGVGGLLITACVAVGLLALVPIGVDAVARLPARRRVVWLSSRFARAQRVRTVALAALIAIGVAVPLGMTLLNASFEQRARDGDRPRVPPGQVAVLTPPAGAELVAADIARLEEAAGGAAVATYEPDPDDVFRTGYVAIGGLDQSELTIVNDRAQAVIALGWAMTDADWQQLEAGRALWLSEIPAPSDPLAVVAMQTENSDWVPTGSAVVPVAPLESPPGSALAWGPAVITADTANSLGLDVRVAGLRFPGADARYGAIVEAAAQIGVPGDLVRRYTPPGGEPPFSFTAALSAVAALVAAGVVLVVWTGVREDRIFDATASALGTRAREIAAVHALTIGAVAVAGAIVGLIAGVGVALAELTDLRSGIALALPWGDIALVMGGALAMTVLTASATAWVSLRRTAGGGISG